MPSKDGKALQVTLHRTPSGHSVRRVYKCGKLMAYSKTFARSSAYLTELTALKLLRSSLVIVPDVIDECDDGNVRCLILSAVAGYRLPCNAWTGKKKWLFAAQLGQTIARLQLATRGRYSEATAIAIRNWQYIETKLKDVEFSGKDIVVRRLRDAAEWLEASRDELVLVHRDLRRANLIWNQAREELCLIDFEVAIWGSPEGDFGRLFVLEIPTKDVWTRLLEAYESMAGFKLSEERLNYFALVFCVEMLAWLQQQQEKTPEEQQIEYKIMTRIPQLTNR